MSQFRALIHLPPEGVGCHVAGSGHGCSAARMNSPAFASSTRIPTPQAFLAILLSTRPYDRAFLPAALRLRRRRSAFRGLAVAEHREP